MLKITVRYPDEQEFAHFLHIFQGPADCRSLPEDRPRIARIKPPLGKPGKKGPDSPFYRRDLWLTTSSVKQPDA